MVSLIAKSPCDGLFPIEIGGTTLTEVVPEALTLVAPLKGNKGVVDIVLKDSVGAGFPPPNRATGKAEARCIWVGPGQAMVMGPSVSPPGAAVTDQSDAFAIVAVTGPLAEKALARLTPIDVRLTVFKRGHTARTLLNHMTCSITRTGPTTFEIMVFRSMARTAVHDLSEALTRVAGLERLR